jgi:hypothetical protein
MPPAGRCKINIVTGPPPLPPARRSQAVSCLCLNLLATPGWGSFVAGHRVTGVLQVLLAVSGVVLTLIWFGGFIFQRIQDLSLAEIGDPHCRWALIGVGLFAAAWCWALATSLQILRAARTTNA